MHWIAEAFYDVVIIVNEWVGLWKSWSSRRRLPVKVEVAAKMLCKLKTWMNDVSLLLEQVMKRETFNSAFQSLCAHDLRCRLCTFVSLLDWIALQRLRTLLFVQVHFDSLHDVVAYMVEKTDGSLTPLNIEAHYDKNICMSNWFSILFPPNTHKLAICFYLTKYS